MVSSTPMLADTLDGAPSDILNDVQTRDTFMIQYIDQLKIGSHLQTHTISVCVCIVYLKCI